MENQESNTIACWMYMTCMADEGSLWWQEDEVDKVQWGCGDWIRGEVFSTATNVKTWRFVSLAFIWSSMIAVERGQQGCPWSSLVLSWEFESLQLLDCMCIPDYLCFKAKSLFQNSVLPYEFQHVCGGWRSLCSEKEIELFIENQWPTQWQLCSEGFCGSINLVNLSSIQNVGS